MLSKPSSITPHKQFKASSDVNDAAGNVMVTAYALERPDGQWSVMLVNRDQSNTQQAADAFNDLIRRYPETRYAADARVKLDLIKDHLAGKEMDIGRFYQRSGQWLAATYRFRTVIDQYQTTSGTPEALERLVECYLALGMPQEAQKAAAVLGRNYPETFWYKQSLRLLGRENKQVDRRTASRK